MQVDLTILDKYVEDKLLIKAEDSDLVQYNYSEYCNNNNLFDEITVFNRGNIYEKTTGRLVARSMPKFFNFEQLPEEKQAELLNKKKFICTQKYDGCLGIIYWYKRIRYNSRGSFNSFVTTAMSEILHQYKITRELLSQYNLVVEVIHPDTHIVVDYNNQKLFRLITAYDTKQFNEVPFSTLKDISMQTEIPIVEAYNWGYERLFHWQKEHFDEVEEGFVLRYQDDYRVKIKSLQYFEATRAKCHLNENMILRLCKETVEQKNNSLREYFEILPDEMIKIGKLYLRQIVSKIHKERKIAESEYQKYKDLTNKELGLLFKDSPNKYSGYIFAKRSNKSTKLPLIKLIIKIKEQNEL